MIRRGFGQSDGVPGRPGGGAYGPCGTHAESLIDASADDLAATLAVIAERPDADPNRVVLFGQSAAGPAVLALAARGLPRSTRGGADLRRAELLERERAVADVHATPRMAHVAADDRMAPGSWYHRCGSMPPTTIRSLSRWRARCMRSMPAPARLLIWSCCRRRARDGHHIFVGSDRARSLAVLARYVSAASRTADLARGLDRSRRAAGRHCARLSLAGHDVPVVRRAAGPGGRPCHRPALRRRRGCEPASKRAMFAIKLCREDGGTEASCVPVMENFRLLLEHRAEAPAVR